MENQRLFLFMALGFIMLLLWQQWQADYVLPQQAAQIAQNAASPSAADESQPSQDDVDLSGSPVIVESTEQSNSSKITVVTDTINVVIDTRGGEISSLSLQNYPVSLQQKDTPFSLLNAGGDFFFVAQSGLQGKDATLPNHTDVFTAEQSEYRLADGQDVLSVPLRWEDNGVEVIKTLTFRRDSYVIDVEQVVINKTGKPVVARSYMQLQRSQPPSNNGLGALYSYTGAITSTPEEVYTKIDFDDIREENLSLSTKSGWVAMIQHYFAAAVVPNPDITQRFYTRSLQQGSRFLIGTQGPNIEIADASEEKFAAKYYIGPKLQNRLDAVAPNLRLTVDFGYLSFFSELLYWLLQKIHHFLGNWGWSIIVLTIIIKSVFYPLSKMSYVSQARMRKLTPKIQSIRENYANDRQKMGQETMALYSKEKVNPLGGCLPVLIQIPVFIGLYWMLAESVELRQAPWLGWIQDLSLKDPYFVLPLIYGATMFIQQRLNPPPMDPVQAKVFQFMPIMFTVFFLFFPSGLVLYWIVNNTLTILQQWVVTRQIMSDDK